MTEPKWEELKKMSLKEIKSRDIRIDFASYLTKSEPLRAVCVKVSIFELDDSFSARLGLLLDNSFFDRVKMSSKEREQIVKKFERFPKLKVFESINGIEYEVENVIRHSIKVLEVKLALDKIENVVLEELPYRIRWIWTDILDRFS